MQQFFYFWLLDDLDKVVSLLVEKSAFFEGVVRCFSLENFLESLLSALGGSVPVVKESQSSL